MAILQLSRITNRKGLAEDLPQLAGAELGWVLDDRKLYIGNGTIEDGAPVIGNTEILTEFSDILALSASYTYQGSAAGYVVNTGENDSEIVRSLQSKFDDMASVKDFGAIGDGVADDTDAINRALYELFCREINPEVRRSLFFPAGRYRVSARVKVPPHAKLYGEGLTSSIILFISSTPVVSTSLVAGQRYAISAVGSTDFIALGATSNTVDHIFIATASGPGTGTARAVDDSVVETSDSLQQLSANIGNNGAIPPTGIEMISMAVESTEENTLLKLDSVSNSGFHYLGLHGVYNNADLVSIGNSTSAIEIATNSGPTSNITISKLDTAGTTYGLRVEGKTKGIVLENSGINLHYKGVYVTNPTILPTAIISGNRYKIMTIVSGDDFTTIGATYNRVGQVFESNTSAPPGFAGSQVILMDDAGPTGVVISRNIFDNIANEGIHYENVLFNSSGYNVFYNVGNAFGSSAATAVIQFDSDQCISVGDLFERADETDFSRVALGRNGGVFIDGAHSIHLGSYERQIGIAAILQAGILISAPETIFEFEHDTANSYKIDYNIRRNADDTRLGRIYISNASTNADSITWNDEFTESADTEIVLSIVNVEKGLPGSETYTTSALQFTSSAGLPATMNFSVVRLD